MLGLPLGLGRGTRLLKNSLKISDFVQKGLQLHYKPESRGSVIGTAPDVTAINDLSENAHNATVTGNITQLTHATKGNALLRLTYDGGNRIDTGIQSLNGNTLHCSAGNTWEVYLCVENASFYKGFAIAQGIFGNIQFALGWKSDNGGTIFLKSNNSDELDIATNVGAGLWVASIAWDGSSLTASYMLENETAFTSATLTPGAGAELTTNNIFIGCRDSAGGSIFNGSIGEIVMYERALDAAEKIRMESYFAKNWTNKQFDARVILLGDSIMQGSWDSSQDITAMDIDVAFGVFSSAYVDVYEEGYPGKTAEFIAQNIDSILTTYTPEPYPTYFVGHIGTNNVTQTRPSHEPVNRFDALIDGFAEDLDYIYNAITTAGYHMIYGQMPFYDRPFPDPDSGDRDYLCVTYQYMGARPYNENIVEPWLNANTPQYCFPDGTPYLQFYDLSYNDTSILSIDGIHPSFLGYQTYYKYLAEVVGKVVKGVVPTKITAAPDDVQTGVTFVVATNSETDPGGTEINWTQGTMNTAGGVLEDLGVVGAFSDPSPFQLDYSTYSSHNIYTKATSGNTTNSVNNSTLQESDMRTYVSGGGIFLEAVNLPPGHTVRASIIGSAALTSPKDQLVSFEGQTALSQNIASFPPTIIQSDIIVPDDGRLSIQVTENNDNNIVSICGVSFEVLS